MTLTTGVKETRIVRWNSEILNLESMNSLMSHSDSMKLIDIASEIRLMSVSDSMKFNERDIKSMIRLMSDSGSMKCRDTWRV